MSAESEIAELRSQLGATLARLNALETKVSQQSTDRTTTELPSLQDYCRSIPDGTLPTSTQASLERCPAGTAKGAWQVKDWNDAAAGSKVAGMMFLMWPAAAGTMLYCLAEKKLVITGVSLSSDKLTFTTENHWVIYDSAGSPIEIAVNACP